MAFHALVSEDGGRLGVGAVRFVNFLATHAGSSMGERRAFVSFALQRLRCATTVKGGCALINDRSPSGGGPSRSCRGFCLCRSPRGAQRPPGPGPYRAPTWRRRHRGMPRHSRPRRRFPNAQQCLGTPPFWVFMLYVYTSQTGRPPLEVHFARLGLRSTFGHAAAQSRPPDHLPPRVERLSMAKCSSSSSNGARVTKKAFSPPNETEMFFVHFHQFFFFFYCAVHPCLPSGGWRWVRGFAGPSS